MAAQELASFPFQNSASNTRISLIPPRAISEHQGVKKQQLPEKICATCGRPFKWRKKWERVWDEVKFCSDRCRMKKSKAPPV